VAKKPAAVEWVELAAYAREQGFPERTLRRRMSALHARQGNVLRAQNEPGKRVRKWWLNPDALRAPATPTVERNAAELDAARVRLQRLEAQATKMRDELVKMRHKLAKQTG
jgi:hypothetical protein